MDFYERPLTDFFLLWLKLERWSSDLCLGPNIQCLQNIFPSLLHVSCVIFCSFQPPMVHWLSSSIFPWLLLFVVPLWWHSTKSPFFLNKYRHKSPILTQYHLIPSSAKYWPSTTKYQPVTPHTDSVPPITNQYRLLLTQYHHLSTSFAPYWPSTTKYQPVPPHTDRVPPSTDQYRSALTQYHHISIQMKCPNIQMSDFPLLTWDEHSCTLV